jgi:hypothetical protein
MKKELMTRNGFTLIREEKGGKLCYFLINEAGEVVRPVSSVFALDELREMFPSLSGKA